MFSTMSSGGLSPHSTSIAFYNNPLVEWNVILFMFLTSANFYLHYHALANRRLRSYWESSEFRSYIIIIAVATLVIFAMIWEADQRPGENGPHLTVQVVSISSSTGFTTADFAAWESGAILVLLIVMAIGGSTGSSAGGIKVADHLGPQVRVCQLV